MSLKKTYNDELYIRFKYCNNKNRTKFVSGSWDLETTTYIRVDHEDHGDIFYNEVSEIVLFLKTSQNDNNNTFVPIFTLYTSKDDVDEPFGIRNSKSNKPANDQIWHDNVVMKIEDPGAIHPTLD